MAVAKLLGFLANFLVSSKQANCFWGKEFLVHSVHNSFPMGKFWFTRDRNRHNSFLFGTDIYYVNILRCFI